MKIRRIFILPQASISMCNKTICVERCPHVSTLIHIISKTQDSHVSSSIHMKCKRAYMKQMHCSHSCAQTPISVSDLWWKTPEKRLEKWKNNDVSFELHERTHTNDTLKSHWNIGPVAVIHWNLKSRGVTPGWISWMKNLIKFEKNYDEFRSLAD